MKTRIVIHLEGGIIQNIFHDEPLPSGLEFFIVEEIEHGGDDAGIATSADGEERYISRFETELSEVAVSELLPAEGEPEDEEAA